MVGSLTRRGGFEEAEGLFVAACIVDEVHRLNVVDASGWLLLGEVLSGPRAQGGWLSVPARLTSKDLQAGTLSARTASRLEVCPQLGLLFVLRPEASQRGRILRSCANRTGS